MVVKSGSIHDIVLYVLKSGSMYNMVLYAELQKRSSSAATHVRLPDKLIENHAAMSLNTLVGIF